MNVKKIIQNTGMHTAEALGRCLLSDTISRRLDERRAGWLERTTKKGIGLISCGALMIGATYAVNEIADTIDFGERIKGIINTCAFVGTPTITNLYNTSYEENKYQN